jgi:hypothetical protein
MSWKYVIMKTGNREVPIIFPSSQTHSVMADAFKLMMVAEAQFMANGQLSPANLKTISDAVTVASAGECNIDCDYAGGKSETLKISSRSDDARRIAYHPYTHGLTDGDELNDILNITRECKATRPVVEACQEISCPVCHDTVTIKSLDHTLIDVTTYGDLIGVPREQASQFHRYVVSECRKGKL